MLATTRLIAGETTWTLLAMLVVQVVAAAGAAWLATGGRGRGLFGATVCVQLLIAVLTLNALSSLTIWQRGELFATAVLLSVYRDRLLALPGRIQEGEGVFAVLKWR